MVRDRHLDNATWGVTFLGRDEKTWGADNIGDIAIDPDICPENPRRCPTYRDREVDYEHDKIHLVVASFRDRLCPRTLYNLFSRAEHPHRIFVRVLQQIQPDSDLVDDADCWQRLCDVWSDGSPEHKLLDGTQFDCQEFRPNVEIVTLDSNKAGGPCDARAKLSALIEWDYRHARDGKHRLEPVNVRDYCMQTDSHMDFSDGFDVKMIQMFHRAENDRAVLSTYVTDIEENNKDPKDVPNLCMIEFTSTWRNWGTKLMRKAKKPKLTNLVWGAGMSFQKCHAELNVPYDPFLDNVFDGEETSRGIRFFTHGYDVYTPDKVLVTHDYHGHQSNPIIHTWGGNKKATNTKELQDQQRRDLFDKVDWSFYEHIDKLRSEWGDNPKSTRRVNLLMGVKDLRTPGVLFSDDVIRNIQNGRYGLGKIRNLDQAYQFAGFSPETHKMFQNQCGNLKWVPYTETEEMTEANEWGVTETLNRQFWNESEPIQPPPPTAPPMLHLKNEGVAGKISNRFGQLLGGQNVAARGLGVVGVAGGSGVGIPTTPYTHKLIFRCLGWTAMLFLLIGGYMQRRGWCKRKKSLRSQL